MLPVLIDQSRDRLCWQVRDDSYGCRIADNVLAFDLGCEDASVRGASLLIELLL
jgi:hypothetical protein